MDLEKATDMELVMTLATHIENPCGVEVDGKSENIRYFYIRESKRILDKLTNLYARKFLQEIINEYTSS